MMHTSLFLNAVLLLSTQAPAVEITWEAPAVYIVGQPFPARATLKGAGGGAVEVWKLGPSGFEVNGQPLGAREGAATVPVSGTLTAEHDLASLLPQSGTFKLGFAGTDKTVD